MVKAVQRGDTWLADRVYSGVPAGWFGRQQEIAIGHQSGLSNIRHWLMRRDLPNDEELVQNIFQYAKRGNRLLNDDEVLKS